MIGRFSPLVPDAHQLPERQPLTDHDTTERLGVDDMAAVCAEEHLSAAMLGHQRSVLATQASAPGVCSNCGAACLPAAVYCDDDCRQDHEARLQTQRRQGSSR